MQMAWRQPEQEKEAVRNGDYREYREYWEYRTDRTGIALFPEAKVKTGPGEVFSSGNPGIVPSS